MLRIKKVLLEIAFLGRSYVVRRGAKRRMLRFGNPVPCPSVALHMALAPDFRFRVGLQANMDWHAWLDIAARDGGIGYVRHPLLGHRIHGETETSGRSAGAGATARTSRSSRRCGPALSPRRSPERMPVLPLERGLTDCAHHRRLRRELHHYQLDRSPLRKLLRRPYLRAAAGFVEGAAVDLGCGVGELLSRLPAGSMGLGSTRRPSPTAATTASTSSITTAPRTTGRSARCVSGTRRSTR